MGTETLGLNRPYVELGISLHSSAWIFLVSPLHTLGVGTS